MYFLLKSIIFNVLVTPSITIFYGYFLNALVGICLHKMSQEERVNNVSNIILRKLMIWWIVETVIKAVIFLVYHLYCICLLLDDLECQDPTKTGRPILQASKEWHPRYHGQFLKPVAYKVFFTTFPPEDGKCYTGETF